MGMYENINQEILEVKERVRRREKVLNLINHAEINVKEETQRKDELKNILDKEELDVKKLEGLSFKGIFLAVIGNKEEKMDKERAEYIAAKLKFDECCNSINFMQLELEEYYRQLRDIGNANNDYNELMQKKEQLVMQAEDKNTKQILELMEQTADIEADLRELREAIAAGNSVLHSLQKASNSLDSAEGWGTWDMLGGGFLSDMAKHSNIDEAVEHIQEAKSKLNTFRRELADVNLSIDVNVDISSFDKFADFFFDGIFADWNMQSKIQDSSHSVDSAIRSIDSILYSLKIKSTDKDGQLSSIKAQIKSIIESA
jgi:hypothetical protein